MQSPALQQRLLAYQQWRSRLVRGILDLEQWLENHRRATSRAREQLSAALEEIRQDRLTVALVAESSRGTAELINALFFPDLGGRLLPSSTGYATLSPTELLWDDLRNEAYLRLLPVETRAQDIPISTLKSDPRQWVHYPLNVQAPEQLAETLKEIAQTKAVSVAEATRLGLSSAEVDPLGCPAVGLVEIPKWRYAVVSFPHPLLKQGLVILDTPGLYALGREPELSIAMLPAVQAVLFVLSAQTGVTSNDLEIWQQHLKGFQNSRQQALLVALNEVDLLWDGQRDATALESAVATQCRNTAKVLGIAPDQVFPVSAQKGLVARIRKDDALLRRSALPVLERQLALRLLESKHRSLTESIDARIGQVLDRNRTRLASRIARLKAQLDQLEQLRTKSQEVITQLLTDTRREQELYLKAVARFQQCREELLIDTRPSRQILDGDNIESLIEQGEQQLLGSWTTAGLSRAMNTLFEDLRRVMQGIATDSERVRRLVRETYLVFRDEFGFDLATPKVFVPMKYRVEIELLFQEVDAFRHSPIMASSSQSRVIRRFQQEMVSRGRVLFDQLRVAYDDWIHETLQPLAEGIQAHKTTMERHLENLQRIGGSKEALQRRIDNRQGQYVGFAQELTALRNIYNALHFDPLMEQESPQRPRQVSG